MAELSKVLLQLFKKAIEILNYDPNPDYKARCSPYLTKSTDLVSRASQGQDSVY